MPPPAPSSVPQARTPAPFVSIVSQFRRLKIVMEAPDIAPETLRVPFRRVSPPMTIAPEAVSSPVAFRSSENSNLFVAFKNLRVSVLKERTASAAVASLLIVRSPLNFPKPSFTNVPEFVNAVTRRRWEPEKISLRLNVVLVRVSPSPAEYVLFVSLSISADQLSFPALSVFNTFPDAVPSDGGKV